MKHKLWSSLIALSTYISILQICNIANSSEFYALIAILRDLLSVKVRASNAFMFTFLLTQDRK